MEERDQERIEEEKSKTFMAAVRKILKAKKKTVEILRSHSMSFMKTIERASRSTKDPNPLSTAMMLMGTKYPLSVDKSLVRKYKIPRRFFPDNSFNREDFHSFNRVIAKKDIIDYWITNGPTPDPAAQGLIDILARQSNADVKMYYDINWKNASIKWGPPVIERIDVATREPSIDIPKELRIPALNEVLFPEFTIPSPNLTKTTLSKLDDLKDLAGELKIPLAKQAHILLDEMDPRVRCIPNIAGASDSLIPIKHALIHNNYVVTGCQLSGKKGGGSWSKDLTNLGAAFILAVKRSAMPIQTVWKDIKKVKILGSSVGSILTEQTGIEETPEVKWIKTLYGIPTNLECKRGRFITSPLSGTSLYRSISNKKGLPFRVPRETVSETFKFGEMRGKFSHRDGLLISCSVNYLTYPDLIEVIGEIAVHIGYGFTDTSSKLRKDAEFEVKKKLERKVYEFIGGTKATMLQLKKIDPTATKNFGCMEVTPNTEYFPKGKSTLSISVTGDLEDDSKQTLTIDADPSKIKAFDESFTSLPYYFLEHFDFKHALWKMVEFYLDNFEELVTIIREQSNFVWKNIVMEKFTTPFSGIISATCRGIIAKMIERNNNIAPVIATLYCFCHHMPERGHPPSGDILIQGIYIFDYQGRKGIFLYSEEEQRYYLFGKPLRMKSTRLKSSDILKGELYGYRILNEVKKPDELPVRTVRYLQKQRDAIEEGTIFKTRINGEIVFVVRDSSRPLALYKTHLRHQEERDRLATEYTRSVAYKRKMELEQILVPSSRPRLEEEVEDAEFLTMDEEFELSGSDDDDSM